MVVEETRRSYMYLNLYHYPVDGVFINGVLPDHTGSSFMENWQRIQKGYLEELESVFTEVPITRIPWFPAEIRGMEAVERLSREALSENDLFDRPVRTDNEIYAQIEGGYSLTIRVPGASQEDVEVFMREMDVDIRIRNFMRSIPLPGVLRGAQMTSAIVADGTLTICFRTKEADG
jgi:arsenite-transporting ATPase